MPQRATEIAHLPLIPGTDLTQGSAGQIWQKAVKTIAAQPGNLSVHWGIQIEKPDVVQFVIDWSDIQDHKTFISSPTYGPFLDNLGLLLSGPPLIFHAHLPPNNTFPSGPGSAPVTECLTLYFSPSYPSPTYSAAFAKFQAAIASYPDLRGIAGGWVVEELEKEGEKKKAFAAFLGWDSVEKHQAFRESDLFRDVIAGFREGWESADMAHVGFVGR
ncbi:hypothetical protein B0J11DRAFT_513861 [Dendryphion nanum]|uniref:ABM domain-containing protein n=1 Tax=Dendryphion nanum TaxID=256645 RepID=A0A9P9IWI6_9PLEO|nr:hypothetical protein B0J11DRAFT_513861 [Dendryphion nanum]